MEYVIIILYFFVAVIWIWALIDLFKTEFESRTMKGLWLMAILLFPVIGSIIYFQTVRNSAAKNRRKFQPDFTDFDKKQLV